MWQLRTACEDDPFDVGFVGEFIAVKLSNVSLLACAATVMLQVYGFPSSSQLN